MNQGYPPGPGPGYPPQAPQGAPPGYPPPTPGYPPQAPQGAPPGYPSPTPGYPPQAPQGAPPGYPPPTPGYPPQAPQGAPPGYPPQGGYAPPPAQGYMGQSQGGAAQADPTAHFRGADSAKANYSRTYLNTENGPENKQIPSPGEYVLAFDSIEAINIPAVPGSPSYSGPATTLGFSIKGSTNPAHPVGADRAYFLKMDTKGIEQAFKTLRNLVVAMFGWDESRDAAAIAAWLGQSPTTLQDFLISMARDKETHAQMKGREVRCTMRVQVSKTSGFPYSRPSFHPMQ